MAGASEGLFGQVAGSPAAGIFGIDPQFLLALLTGLGGTGTGQLGTPPSGGIRSRLEQAQARLDPSGAFRRLPSLGGAELAQVDVRTPMMQALELAAAPALFGSLLNPFGFGQAAQQFTGTPPGPQGFDVLNPAAGLLQNQNFADLRGPTSFLSQLFGGAPLTTSLTPFQGFGAPFQSGMNLGDPTVPPTGSFPGGGDQPVLPPVLPGGGAGPGGEPTVPPTVSQPTPPVTQLAPPPVPEDQLPAAPPAQAALQPSPGLLPQPEPAPAPPVTQLAPPAAPAVAPPPLAGPLGVSAPTPPVTEVAGQPQAQTAAPAPLPPVVPQPAAEEPFTAIPPAEQVSPRQQLEAPATFQDSFNQSISAEAIPLGDSLGTTSDSIIDQIKQLIRAQQPADMQFQPEQFAGPEELQILRAISPGQVSGFNFGTGDAKNFLVGLYGEEAVTNLERESFRTTGRSSTSVLNELAGWLGWLGQFGLIDFGRATQVQNLQFGGRIDPQLPTIVGEAGPELIPPFSDRVIPMSMPNLGPMLPGQLPQLPDLGPIFSALQGFLPDVRSFMQEAQAFQPPTLGQGPPDLSGAQQLAARGQELGARGREIGAQGRALGAQGRELAAGITPPEQPSLPTPIEAPSPAAGVPQLADLAGRVPDFSQIMSQVPGASLPQGLPQLPFQFLQAGGTLDPNAVNVVGEAGPEAVVGNQVTPLPGTGLPAVPGFQPAPLQGIGTEAITGLLGQPAPEQQAFQTALPALQQQLQQNPGAGIIQALDPIFQRQLQFGLGQLRNLAPSVFNSGLALQGTDFARQALQDAQLRMQQALQQGITQQQQAAQTLGGLGGLAGQQPFQRALGAGQLGLQQALGQTGAEQAAAQANAQNLLGLGGLSNQLTLGLRGQDIQQQQQLLNAAQQQQQFLSQFGLTQQQQLFNQFMGPIMQLLLSSLGFATPTGFQTVVGPS